MPNRVPLPRELLREPFTTVEVDLLGVARGRLRAKDVGHPHHGVNSTTVADNLRERAGQLALVLRPHEGFSHTTAAVLLGAPLPFLRDGRLHVTVSGGADRMRRPGVVGHRASTLPMTMLGTLPVVAPAHVWVQLATLLTHDDLVAVGDYLVTPNRRAKTPAIASIDALGAAIPERGRGAARARSALADVRVGAESRMETLLRLLLVRSGLPEPTLNPAIRVGDQTLHPDLLYSRWRVAIEYEGDRHRTDPHQWQHDIWRREVFANAGWRQLRVTRDDVLKHPEQLLARVCRALAQQR